MKITRDRGQSRLLDLTLGICNHGFPCCPHAAVGVRITGSTDFSLNNLDASRFGDLGVHSCPHCAINMCVQGSPDDNIDNLPAHRVTDVVTEFCGVGITILGSGDSNVNS